MLEDILSNISDLPYLEEVTEITIDHDLSELEDFASDTEEMPPLEEVIEITINRDLSDTEEMPPLEDVPYGESPHNNEPKSVCARPTLNAYFSDPINALERF